MIGAYMAPLLIPGTIASARSAKLPSILAHRSRAQRQRQSADDVRLEVGDVTQSVDVVDSPLLLEASDASIGIVVSTRELTELPSRRETVPVDRARSGHDVRRDQTLNRPYEPTGIVDYSMSGSVSARRTSLSMASPTPPREVTAGSGWLCASVDAIGKCRSRPARSMRAPAKAPAVS